MSKKVQLIGVDYSPFWPFGRTETVMAERDLDEPRFMISDFEKRIHDRIITREVDR